MNEKSWVTYLTVWVISLLAASTISAGRIANLLFGPSAPDPPDDEVLLGHWKRRRTWIILSELSALPAFATLAEVGVIYRGVELWLAVPLSMLFAIIGFLLLIDGVQRAIRRRLQITWTEPE